MDRGYPHRDPPLTDLGMSKAVDIKLSAPPDLIVLSPMTRTIQTALIAFDTLIGSSPFKADVQVWPNLRETYDAEEMEQKLPQFNSLTCSEQWDYAPYSVEDATKRAECVRRDLKQLTKMYNNIALVTHRGFIAFLVQGSRFDVCGTPSSSTRKHQVQTDQSPLETRSYRFAEDDEVEGLRYSTSVDTQTAQDFGPTALVHVLENIEGIIKSEPKVN